MCEKENGKGRKLGKLAMIEHLNLKQFPAYDVPIRSKRAFIEL
jgi:hypothetical protein